MVEDILNGKGIMHMEINEKKLKAFAVISADINYGKQLCQDLQKLCRDNGCNFLFRAFCNIDQFHSNDQYTVFTHILLVAEHGGHKMVQQIRQITKHATILLLTESKNDIQSLYRQKNIFCALPPKNEVDLTNIMNILYGSKHRFLPEGRDIRILSMR